MMKFVKKKIRIKFKNCKNRKTKSALNLKENKNEISRKIKTKGG